MKKIVSVYGRWVSFLTVLVLVFAGIFTIPKCWGWKPLIVMSGSMEPTIPTGSVLFINTNVQDISVDDIVTFYLDTGDEVHSTFVTHRIIRKEEKRYITKGDHNESEDFVPLRAEQIVGTYIFHIPKAGWIISKLDQKLLVMAAVWLLLLNIFSIILNSMFCGEEE